MVLGNPQSSFRVELGPRSIVVVLKLIPCQRITIKKKVKPMSIIGLRNVGLSYYIVHAPDVQSWTWEGRMLNPIPVWEVQFGLFIWSWAILTI